MKRLAITFLLVSASAFASESHALLIGIGAYKMRPLTGPPNDVASMRTLLIDKYKYKAEFVHTVIDQQATKQGILQALKQLVDEVKPGDYVFFYYSGHGTSFYAGNALNKFVAEDSGASLPVDFDASSPEAFGRSILLGRELRPYLTELDKKAQVFAIYDSCYSQDAMKALQRGTPKYVAPSQVVQGTAKGDLDDAEQTAATGSAADANAPLPYQHLIAISAAKRDQMARDISAEDLKRNPDATADHKPHGQLTNAVLMGLNGAADKNHDGVITHEELFNYVNEVSAGKWSHNPKLRTSSDSGTAALRRAALTGKAVTIENACSQGSWRQSRISAPPKLFGQLGNGFVAVDENWDVKVVPQGNEFLLFDAGGVQMNDKPMAYEQTLARLKMEPVIEQLSELHYCRQTFNMELAVIPDNGKYFSKQQISFSAKVDRSAYVMVIDLDQEGGVTVVYPVGQALPLKAGETTKLSDNEVLEPYGVDLLKAFAFESKPAGFDRFVAPQGKAVYLKPGDPAVKDLLEMLVKDAPDRSETKLQLTTSRD